MTHQIRRASPGDTRSVVALVDAAYLKYVTILGRQPAPLLADYPALIHQEKVFVLTTRRHIDGILVLELADDHVFLENIAVHPNVQRTGLGRRMMAFVEDTARQANMSEVRLYTNELMIENIEYYRRLGYSEIARKDVDGFRRVSMRKLLSDSPSTRLPTCIRLSPHYPTPECNCSAAFKGAPAERRSFESLHIDHGL